MNLEFKRHYRLIALLALAAILLILGLGDQRIIAYTAQGNEQAVIRLAQAGISGWLNALGIH
jgi:hypothetical protein